MGEVTRVLAALQQGDLHAADELLPLVYEELRKLAAAKLAFEKPGQTFQATALVHEAYLRLVDREGTGKWDGSGHFFAAAAEAMRRILIDLARQKRSQRHGGGRQRCDLEDGDRITLPLNDDLLDLDEALTRLSAVDPQAAELVKLRVFAGLSVEESAAAQGVSSRTAKRDWAYARAWLGRALADS